MIDPTRDLIRQRNREQVRALSAADRLRAGAEIARFLEATPWLRPGLAVAGFWSLPTEVPMLVVQMLIERLGAHYHLPVLRPGKQLAFARFCAGDGVKPNRFGIPEPAAPGSLLAPSELDLVLLPLSAFDRDGHRLGSGGGWYDRSFAFRKSPGVLTPRLVGIGFACQEQPNLPVAEWDVPLDAVITERELVQCRSSGNPVAS
ncbi:MAG: 5-formyltetrahydrofolate cyclo-ligase [Ahniella sp.]|nr:5-formyltetrahydrofolate cyclo-ligase [Ahniella sp.]